MYRLCHCFQFLCKPIRGKEIIFLKNLHNARPQVECTYKIFILQPANSTQLTHFSFISKLIIFFSFITETLAVTSVLASICTFLVLFILCLYRIYRKQLALDESIVASDTILECPISHKYRPLQTHEDIDSYIDPNNYRQQDGKGLELHENVEGQEESNVTAIHFYKNPKTINTKNSPKPLRSRNLRNRRRSSSLDDFQQFHNFYSQLTPGGGRRRSQSFNNCLLQGSRKIDMNEKKTSCRKFRSTQSQDLLSILGCSQRHKLLKRASMTSDVGESKRPIVVCHNSINYFNL